MNSRKPLPNYGGRSAAPSTPIDRSFTTCAVRGRNGVGSIWASSWRPAGSCQIGPQFFALIVCLVGNAIAQLIRDDKVVRFDLCPMRRQRGVRRVLPLL